MNAIKLKSAIRSRLRNAGATLFGAALGFAIAASALAADAVTLRVGDQKGGNRSLLEIAGLAKDLPWAFRRRVVQRRQNASVFE
jgi:sulfonate transport system substrate-binding protein